MNTVTETKFEKIEVWGFAKGKNLMCFVLYKTLSSNQFFLKASHFILDDVKLNILKYQYEINFECFLEMDITENTNFYNSL